MSRGSRRGREVAKGSGRREGVAHEASRSIKTRALRYPLLKSTGALHFLPLSSLSPSLSLGISLSLSLPSLMTHYSARLPLDPISESLQTKRPGGVSASRCWTGSMLPSGWYSAWLRRRASSAANAMKMDGGWALR